jgi:hypothetical protein
LVQALNVSFMIGTATTPTLVMIRIRTTFIKLYLISFRVSLL